MDIGFNFLFELIKPFVLWCVILPVGLLALAWLIYIVVSIIKEWRSWKKN